MTVPVSSVTAVTLKSLLRKLGLKKIRFLGVLLSQCCFPTYLTTLLYQQRLFFFLKCQQPKKKRKGKAKLRQFMCQLHLSKAEVGGIKKKYT